MSVQKRPYELSLWSEELLEEGGKTESKMLIIGADTMTYDGRAFGIKLLRKVNGTNTLTFQMLESFFDSRKGKMVKNEFIDELFAERKIKLFYKKKWFEFYIKNVKEEKKHNSVLKTFSCEDSYIDELARNGYGITFDEELYNSVEEIGTFTEEVLEDSIWEYAPEYNWGDFTEYTEEKLFKIKVSNFNNGVLPAFKLNYHYSDFDEEILNANTGDTRGLELGDDLSRAKGYYWDQYDAAAQSKHLLKIEEVLLNSNEYEYIYVPYSCLNFCYINFQGEPTSSSIPDRTATEIPAFDNTGKYYIAPTEVNPNTLIQFIAFKKTDEVNIDEAGLIIDKDYHYVMTLKQWNSMATNMWYIFNDTRYVETTYGSSGAIQSMSYSFKYLKESDEDQLDEGNKCITYDGYLSGLNNIEIIKGKKISITDRTEMNISNDIDSFVKVYNQKSNDSSLINYYSNENWHGDYENYRVCSRSSTRSILPSLARNYTQNGISIQNTTGWETMRTIAGEAAIEPDVKYRVNEEGIVIDSYLSYLVGTANSNGNSIDDNNEEIAKRTFINFGAISQEKKIEKDKVYCLGLKIKIKQNGAFDANKFKIKIAEGSLRSSGTYWINSYQKIEFLLSDFYSSIPSSYSELTSSSEPWATFYAKSSNKEFNEEELYSEGKIQQNEYSGMETKFLLFRTNFDIDKPYIAITSYYDYLLNEIQLFEAYTKGEDFFTNGYFALSGRDFYIPETSTAGFTIKTRQFSSNEDNVPPYHKLTICLVNDIKNKILFENDIMAGTAYEYQKYFIQQLNRKVNGVIDRSYDTFGCTSYLAEDVADENSLPLDSKIYDEDNYEIVTNIIDLTKCSYYQYSNQQCNHPQGRGTTCYYQKYGYCPYLFETEKHCRKIRTLKGEKSNRFNLTQELSKVFKCYPVYYINHEPDGTIKKNQNGKMIKKIYYITEKGKSNIYGFRYGKNLSNIGRNIISNQIVTKLYINDVDSEYSRTGLCSIKTAEDNPSKDSFIIDFSYFTTKGLLSSKQVEKDLYGVEQQDNILSGYLKTLGFYNTQYDNLTNQIINLQNTSFDDIESHLTINTESINVIIKEIKEYNETLAKYSEQTESNIYKNYRNKLKAAETTFYSLLKSTFNPIENGEEIEDLITWFEALEESYGSFEEIIKDLKDNHNWTTGLLGQYNTEYKQIQEWKKERARYLNLINKLSLKFFRKYEPYLKEGTWSDTNYLTDNAYYHGALDVAAQGAIPKVEYTISVIDLSPFDGYEDYELDNGDSTYVEDVSILGYNKRTGFPNLLKVMVSEISEDLDVPTNNQIKVQNFTTQFEDLFQQVTATVQNLTLNENIYRRASNFTSTHGIQEDSFQNTLSNNNFTLVDNAQKNVVMDQSGQSGSNINNRASQYRLTGEGLLFSKDGGVTWKKGLSPEETTDIDVKAENIEAETINVVNQENKIGVTITSDGIESTSGGIGTSSKDAILNENGLTYKVNNQSLLRAGTAFESSLSDYYGIEIQSGSNSILSILSNLMGTDSSVNVNTTYNLTGTGSFNGRNQFNSGTYSIVIGSNADGDAISKTNGDNITFYLRVFSIANGTTNLLTLLANGVAYMGGTIQTFSSDFKDYVRIVDGRTIQTSN